MQRAHRVLPDQGPIGVFVHHNTLHAFQHLDFHAGVQQGAALLGARPYPEETTFRGWLAEGRIAREDLDAAFGEVLGEGTSLAVGTTERALVDPLARSGVDDDDEAGWRFQVSREAWPAGADLALFEAAGARLGRTPRPLQARPRPVRHRDALLALTQVDTDEAVHPELVRLCASFLDHGQATAQMPHRDEGFLRAVARLGAGDLLEQARDAGTPRALLQAQLDALGVGPSDVEAWVLATLLALPGWTGMFARMERHPDERPQGHPVLLLELLAVRALLDRAAVKRVAHDHGLPARWEDLRARVPRWRAPRPTVDALLLAQVASRVGASPSDLAAWSDGALSELWETVAAWPSIRRRAVWLEGYEARYRRTVLDALHAHAPATRAAEAPPRARAQFVFCIDEREEAFRRALEEDDPGFETFGAAGFFGLAVDYRGLDDTEPAPYCPVVATPAHQVHEEVRPDAAAAHARREGWRALAHGVERRLSALSRTLIGGAGVALAGGALAGAVVASRVIAPRRSLAARLAMDEAVAPRPGTRLAALRADNTHKKHNQ